LASFEEVEGRDFLLYFGTKFQVVFGVKACLSQKLSQSDKTTCNDFFFSFVNISRKNPAKHHPLRFQGPEA